LASHQRWRGDLRIKRKKTSVRPPKLGNPCHNGEQFKAVTQAKVGCMWGVQDQFLSKQVAKK
jgi:hypothetical protein